MIKMKLDSVQTYAFRLNNKNSGVLKKIIRASAFAISPDFPNQTKLKNKNMKTKILLTTLIIGAICQFAPQICHAQDVDSMAPVVVKTVPASPLCPFATVTVLAFAGLLNSLS